MGAGELIARTSMRPMVTWISGAVATGETSFVCASAGFRPSEVWGGEVTGLAAVTGWTLTGSTLRISTGREGFTGDPLCWRATGGRIGSIETSFGFGVGAVILVVGVSGGAGTRSSCP